MYSATKKTYWWKKTTTGMHEILGILFVRILGRRGAMHETVIL